MVYLSPDADDVLETIDPEAIYIIGGIADVNIKKVGFPFLLMACYIPFNCVVIRV